MHSFDKTLLVFALLHSVLQGQTACEKVGLKLNIEKTKITSWQIDGETVETVTDFIFLGSKTLQMSTAAMKLKDTYSLEEKL